MEKQSSPTRAGFTLVELMIVVSIIGLLLAIAVPNFLEARERSRSKACVENLRQIDTAKQQYMLDKNILTYNDVTSSDPTLGGLAPNYIRYVPACPIGGTYDTGTNTTDPTCSMAANNPAMYGQTGSYPHYLP